uniref:RFX-type winged-helix domain-containing protein n=1 Tax=Timema monikensis TaxID=170555 RepID=A0A7R9HPI1_9NEOP|nr:unnamed protein product [Timema monikensis]
MGARCYADYGIGLFTTAKELLAQQTASYIGTSGESAYCNSNAMKPLSTADFGKVMKQVFSRVRPRRLGTRGNSRYCYSGLRKKLGLDVPLLPDLGEDSKPLTDHCSTEEMNKSVSYLIREWAEKLLSVKFDSLQDLACYLVQHTCVDSFSGPAFNLAFAMDFKKSGEKGCPTVPLTPPVQPPVQTNKHRETQLQLQRKLQERVVIREQKRSKTSLLDEFVDINTTSFDSSGELVIDTSELEQEVEGKSSPTDGVLKTQLSSSEDILHKGKIVNTRRKSKSSQKKYKLIQPKPQDEITKGKTKPNSDKVVARKPVNLLAKDTNANCDKEDSVVNIVSTNTNLTEMNTEHSSEVTGNTANSNEAVKNGTNDVSIGCLEKDALNDYFHGGNNSQEPEEELMRYFQHHNSPCNEEVYEAVKQTLSNSEEISKGTSFTVKSDELSQLRLLLERNLKPVPSHSKNLYRHVDVERSTTTTPSQIPVSSNSSLLMEGHKDVYNLASGMHTSQLPLAASASLSLLSRRSQQHNRKPSLHLQSLLTGNHGNSLANKRRVSFETPIVEHYQDGSNSCTVPPNPNTSSFTPISPGPYSPVGVHRVSSNSKPSSANASPFVSPRNTPVPRSRHNFSQANLPLSSSYIISSGSSVQGGTNTNRSRRSTAAKIVRSNSVNSHNISSQYQVPQPRAMSPNASLLKSHLADQSNERIFVAPGNLSSEVNVQLPSVASLRQSFMDTSLGRFPPVSPVSTSAPHSPMLHYHQSTLMNSNNNEQEMSVGIPSDTLPDQSVLPQDDPDHVSNTINNASLFGVDSLSQEVSQIFQDGSSDQKNLEALWNALPNSSQYRSQSVPLHRMMSASAMISPQSTQPSPLYMGQQQAFNFNTFSSSATSSVAPTPVPSEFMDFVSIDDNSVAASNLLDGETGETEGLNPESLKQFLNILDTAQQEQSNQEQANIAMSIDESGLDIQTQCQPRLLQPSRSYPNTPLPYKSTVLGDHFNTAMEDNSTKLISLSYPSTPMLGHSTFDNNDELAENETASINQITLNALNSRQGDFGAMVGFSARRNINLLLEEASTLSVEDGLPLEPFDTFSQLVDELFSFPDPERSFFWDQYFKMKSKGLIRGSKERINVQDAATVHASPEEDMFLTGISQVSVQWPPQLATAIWNMLKVIFSQTLD